MGPIDFHSMGKKILRKSMWPFNCLVTDILQNILFCVVQQTKDQRNSYRFGTTWGRV